MQVMLEAGAEKDIADRDGQTPLHLAAMHGHDAVVKVRLASCAPLKAAVTAACASAERRPICCAGAVEGGRGQGQD